MPHKNHFPVPKGVKGTTQLNLVGTPFKLGESEQYETVKDMPYEISELGKAGKVLVMDTYGRKYEAKFVIPERKVLDNLKAHSPIRPGSPSC